MSLFGAMNTAVTGLTAQSAAFANISDNVANSQTVGYKAVDTNFVDYLTSSSAQQNVPGSVVATPGYENNVQGTISQNSDPLALAISGQGFFAVSEQSGTINNRPTFNPQQFYTRAGDFQLNDNGYLVNSAGEFLNGWVVNKGVVDQNTLAPIQVSQTVFNPIATDNIDLSANLPATPASGTGVPATYSTSGTGAASATATIANDVLLMQGSLTPASGTLSDTAANDSGVATDVAAALILPGATVQTVLDAATNFSLPAAGAFTTVSTAVAAATAAASLTGATAETVATAAINAAATSAQAACNAAGVSYTAPQTADLSVAAVPITSQINVFDGLGTAHTVTLNWVQTSANNWTVQVNVPDNKPSGSADCGSANVSFGTGVVASNPSSTAPGTVSNVVTDAVDPGTVTTNTNVPGANSAATLSFNCNFGSGIQAITLNLGTYGQATGLTQYAGTTYDLRGLSQNGVPPGAFSSVTTSTNGNISVNYDNGQSRVVFQVPVITFNAPDQLQRQDAQAFTVSQTSGAPLAEAAGSNGAGALVTQSVEGSNVDIATEFTKLIVAQQAYSANAKLVTTAQQMLTTTVDMKQ